MIREGDSVLHKPTGEIWYVLGVSQKKNELCVAGWPPTIGKISDCGIYEKGTGITAEELKHRNQQFGTNWD